MRGLKSDRRGFTIIEVLVAITVLLVTATAFVPLFVFVSQASAANRTKLVATKLASSEIEKVRALPYHEVGLQGGNPDGALLPQQFLDVDGLIYEMETRVWWVDDPSDNDPLSDFDPIPYDYKHVRVTVTVPGIFGGVTVTKGIDVVVAMEGEEEAFPGGNLRARVERGLPVYGVNIPVENFRIELEEGPSAPQTLWTASNGQALFAVLTEGEYNVRAVPESSGFMIHPFDEVPLPKPLVTQGVTYEVIFRVEYPSRLVLELEDKTTGTLISSGGSVILKPPYSPEITYNFDASSGGVIGQGAFGKLWPEGKYDLQVLAEGYLPYNLSDDDWNGYFDGANQVKTVTLELEPATAGVLVTAVGSGLPVPGANVQIHNDSGLVAENVTGVGGHAFFNLPDSEPDDDYDVLVTKSGYTDPGMLADAFTVVDGEQYVAGVPGIYAVELEFIPVVLTFDNDTMWTVPAGVHSIEVLAWGGGGGGGGGGSNRVGGDGAGAGFATAVLQTTPGEPLAIRVGGGGSGGPALSSGSPVGSGGGGGGYSGIIFDGNALIIAAGGGGGGGGDNQTGAPVGGAGGAGGGTSGTAGGGGGGTVGGGGGGTNSTGGNAGSGAGSPSAGGYLSGGNGGHLGTSRVNGGSNGGGQGGAGNTTDGRPGGGGGGAGFFGGGGGGAANYANRSGGGGGGGSSYTTGSDTETIAGSGRSAGNSAHVHAGTAGRGGIGGSTATNGSSGNDGRVVIYLLP
jgi:prepilin-type N-terminal cleavage/methylation domain-containing protein